MSIIKLSPDTVTWGVIGFRFGRLTTQPAVSAVAVMSYSTSTLSLFMGMTFTCHLPARSAMFMGGGAGGGAGAAAAVVSAAGVLSFLAQATSTAALQSNTKRRIPSSRFEIPSFPIHPIGRLPAALTYGPARRREREPLSPPGSPFHGRLDGLPEGQRRLDAAERLLGPPAS